MLCKEIIGALFVKKEVISYHIGLEKTLPDETLKITVPARKPVKRSTLAKILKQARIDLDYFLELL